MTLRLQNFQSDVGRAKDLVGLGQSLGAMTHGRVDAADLYRAAIVQAVGAIDSYVHGVVLDRATAMLVGKLPLTTAAQKDRKFFGLHFGAVHALLNSGSPAQLELDVRTQLAARLALESFQHADAVAKALATVGISRIWLTAFGAKAESTKIELNLIVDRRNKIVHACDVDPLNPSSVSGLSATDTVRSIRVVSDVVAAIDACC